jgi:hypothetical protein
MFCEESVAMIDDWLGNCDRRRVLVSIHYICRFSVCCFSGTGGPEHKAKHFYQENNGYDLLHIHPTAGAEFPTKRDQVPDYFIDAMLPDFYTESHGLGGARVGRLFSPDG